MSDKACTIWFTGLSGSGKTTIAHEVEKALRKANKKVEILDGDVVRANLSKGLGFSKEDRDTNIRRIGFVAHLLTRNGVFCICAAISPYKEVRNENRKRIGNFIEVYTRCPIPVLKDRDPKGLYEKALKGEIKGFTGVDDPYEAPENPEIICDTDKESLEQSVEKVIAGIKKAGYL
ncbi:MAG: adenylyl-sulfate kinase [Planctomycetes bacterium]|nr:adenylyl-sulfate kinase [Planctomycetota bacterium]